LMTENFKKILSWKNLFTVLFFQKIVIYLSLGLSKGRLSYREAISPQKRAAGPVGVTTRPSNAGPLAKVLYFVYTQPLHTKGWSLRKRP
jgi:hypothetical protein